MRKRYVEPGNVIGAGWLLMLVVLCGCAGGPRQAGVPAQVPSEPRLQFVIIPDRTGGERRGVLARAIEQVNLLQPELVMCVGDMIEGYSEDARVVQGQFEELERLLARLDAPFYYVPGNHDISNPMMAKLWEERFGPRYYYFLKDDVLFICLNTEAGMEQGGLEIQAAKVCRTLETYRDVRFTFVLMHKPVWAGAEVPEWWRRIEYALADRPYAVFAGHEHTYRKETRHGRPYYRLATCGGWSYLDGVYAGLFDHITQVTLVGTNLTVVNFRVDGVLPDDVVTDETVAYGKRLAAEGVHVAPVFIEGADVEQGEMRVTLSNCLQMPVEFEVKVRAEGRVLATPEEIRVALAPGDVAVRSVQLEATRSNTGDVAGVVEMNWQARCEPVGAKAFYTQGRERAGIVRPYVCVARDREIVIDGRLDEWPALRFVCTNPVYFGFDRATWFGADDGSFRFDVRHDDEHVYVAVRVSDEVLMVATNLAAWQQDGVELWIQGNPWEVGARGDGALCIGVSPGEGRHGWALHDEERLPAGIRVACDAAPGGYTVEYAIARRVLAAKQNDDLRELYVNLAMNDYDPPGRNGVQLWWQPDHRSRAGYKGAGTMRLGE